MLRVCLLVSIPVSVNCFFPHPPTTVDGLLSVTWKPKERRFQNKQPQIWEKPNRNPEVLGSILGNHSYWKKLTRCVQMCCESMFVYAEQHAFTGEHTLQAADYRLHMTGVAAHALCFGAISKCKLYLDWQQSTETWSGHYTVSLLR